jgi:GntR family transcriptional regulator
MHGYNSGGPFSQGQISDGGRAFMKEFQIDNTSGIPVWIQVRKRLVYSIVSGIYQPGEQLPTVRELAVQLDINYNTVNKVYQDLERDGFIITRRGKGTFVAELGKDTLLALDNKVELLADELVREGFDFGMTGDEILQTVKACVVQHEMISSGKVESRGAERPFVREARHAG